MSTQFTASSTADEVAATLASEIKGKTILITGVSPSSLGAEAAISLAAQSPALLILASRNPATISATADIIASRSPGVKTRALTLDLSSLEAVRAAAAEVNRWEDVKIDVLINNAGIMACPYGTTKDGFERQFGTNHLGHFLFANLIIGKINKGGRVVSVSSGAHRISGVRFDDVGFKGGEEYEKWVAYGQAKTANILFAVSLAEKLKSCDIKAFSLHPGAIKTNLQQHVAVEELQALFAQHPGITMKTLQQGTATHIVAAFDPSIADKSGAYLEDCNISTPEANAADPANAERLWKLSEELIGQKFEY